MSKLYLAGPDVFRPDAIEWAARVAARCRECGHQGLVPLDEAHATAGDIYRNNLRLIAGADAVLANLNPFRGDEPDSGTCVEVGFALALGKPVIGYADDLRPLRERLRATGPGAGGRYRDGTGNPVEDFGPPLHLMLAGPVQLVQARIEPALAALGTG